MYVRFGVTDVRAEDQVITRTIACAVLWRSGRFLAGTLVSAWILATVATNASAALLGSDLFPADNPWNQNISQAPVATNSAAIISLIGNSRFHPDFGQDYLAGNPLYGIPYNVVHGNSTAKVHIVIDAYADQSDIQDAPLPANPIIEGDMDNGPTVGVDVRGDSHMLIWDQDNNIAYEFYRASRPSENPDGQWHADSETIWDMKTNSFRTLGWTSGDAAGLPILPGLARPDEGLPVAQGGQGIINHALRFTLQNAIILNQYLYPASHTANPGNNNRANQPPMGARFRLKASVNISTMNPQTRVVAQALKDYGLIVADNGSSFFMTGASYSPDANNNFAVTWNDNDIQDTAHGLKSLWFTNFEVVDLTPAITAVSPTQGVAGTSVAITGYNFSGAAGRLNVLFGTNQVAATINDDAHLTALAPAGSGTVDVRVQSGITNANSTANYTKPIWGYGLSATSTVARFTFSALDPFHTWLGSYGLASNGSADYLDSDKDGMNNWQEYVAGTNPTNSNSVFKLVSGQMSSSTQFFLRWLSASNRLYDVMRATNLAAGTGAFVRIPGATNLISTPPQNTWTDSVSRASPPGYYRVSVHQ
ncbi:MAG TPA: IPT/TIG domain-containing protein [Candidatus Dormibacteraeota bacterium]|nr:IPT/TIG domain-containing protein [Candidatus Dormibacteraeota bacterium]